MAAVDRQVVIVTGAGSGIGQATAVEFAKNGYSVVITGRTRSKLEETVKQCTAEGVAEKEILIVVGDVTVPDDNQGILDQTIQRFGQINVLINNAGMPSGRRFEDVTLDHLDDLYKLHVRSVFDLTQKTMPHLLKTKGNVITVSSITGERPNPLSVGYSMMKACIDHFTRAISVDYAPKGVRVNTVNPGYVRTPMLVTNAPPDQYEQVYESRARAMPVGKIMEPQEIARVLLFLASQDAAFITGANLPIDGAWRNTMSMPK